MRQKTAVLCPFWTSLTLLSLSSILLLLFPSLCVSSSLSHFLSPFLSLSESLPPFFFFPPSSYASQEWSPLSFIPSFMCLSFPCSLFFLNSHISPHHYLTNSWYSSQLKLFYLCLSGFVSFLSPSCWSVLAFLTTSYLYSHSSFSYSLPNVPQPPLTLIFPLVIAFHTVKPILVLHFLLLMLVCLSLSCLLRGSLINIILNVEVSNYSKES